MAEGGGGAATATKLGQINLGSRGGRGGHWSPDSRVRASACARGKVVVVVVVVVVVGEPDRET